MNAVAAVQTALVVDLREPDSVLLKLAEARRRFEKGGDVPVAVRDLLVELAGAVADSGPLELGVSPRRWLRVQARMSDLVAGASFKGASADARVARARRALRELRRLAHRIVWSRRSRARFGDARWVPWAVFAFCCVLLAGATWLVESLAWGHFSVGPLAPAGPVSTIFFFACLSSIWRAMEAAAARELAAQHAPEERCLFSCRMPRSRVVIATDERVLAVTNPGIRGRSVPLWSLPHSRITSVEPTTRANERWVILHAGSDTRAVELRVLGDKSQGYDYQRYHQEALSVILHHRHYRSFP